MDAIRRASFASKQIRLGPAPLASFEDLPSDELESPEDVTHLPIQTNALDDESSSQDLQFTTPDSLTVSSQSTPRIESDFDSHFTLTPGDSCEGQSSSDLRTTSLSSLSKDSVLTAKQKKGSALSLGTYDAPETEYNQRKSSWTDIFRTHNTNSAKSSSSIASDSKSEKSTKKKSRSELPKKEGADSKHREKNKFLSIFKKKSGKSTTSPNSTGELDYQDESQENADQNLTFLQNLPEEVVPPKVINGNISKGKENEFPKEIELSPTSPDVQNDLGKVNTEQNDKIPDERKINRKLINISEASFEKEYNILSQQVQEKELDKVSKSENIQAIVDEEEHESSESEPHVEEKEAVLEEEEKEDDFMAETLLTQDLLEGEEDSMIEIQPLSIETPKQVNIPSRQQRLEVTTKPIDRPRSTTPINVAPLEAFIQSVSPTIGSKGEKIKLSLPGEQFLGRLKSPKKSAKKSWTDFCESGLHSPRMNKRTDMDEPDNPFSDSDFPVDVLVPTSNSKWAAFEVNFEDSVLSGFGDNFTSQTLDPLPTLVEQSSTEIGDNYQAFETDFSVVPCSCECHAIECRERRDGINIKDDSSNSLLSSAKKCLCSCHTLPNALSGVDKSTLQDSSSKPCDVANVFESSILEQ